MIAFRGIPRVRKRQIPAKVYALGTYHKLVGGTWIKFADAPKVVPSPNYQELQVTTDEKHPGPPYVTGGPFSSFRVKMSPSVAMGVGVYDTMVPVFVSGQGNIRVQYRGGFGQPTFSTFDYSSAQYANEKFLFGESSGFVPSLDAYYPQVSKVLTPKISEANLGQALAEMREIPSMLRQTASFMKSAWENLAGSFNKHPVLAPKRYADDFLNFQFGWTPFVKDVIDLTRAVMFSADYIRELIRRNGSWEKRDRVINEVVEDLVLGSGDGSRCQPSGVLDFDFTESIGGSKCSWNIRRRRVAKIWCSGEYKFYMPEFDMDLADFDSNVNELRRHLTLYGARISPSLLWKITPWTWLVDWFSNVGSLIEQLENASSDSIVSRNLYLMHRETREVVLQQHANFKSGARTFEFIRLQEAKQRDHASTPFGFGLSPNSLSAKQWTILGALGISKFL